MPVSGRIAVLPADRQALEVKEFTFGEPEPHQVIVRQYASGICHSQLHEIHAARTADRLLGHESTGVVEAAGSAVEHVAPGDTVLVTWVPRSPQAVFRKPEGSRLIFADGTSAASGSVFTWATHTVADERYVVRAPAGTPLDTGAVIGCAVMTGAGAVLHSAEVGPGQSVAVWGAGGVGLSAIAAARNVGASPIIAVDLDDEKLQMAKRFGATLTVNARQVDAVEEVRRLTPGTRPGELGGVDVAFDCIGRVIATQQAIAAVRRGRWAETRGGSAFLVGVPTEPVTVDSTDLLLGEKRFIGSLGGSCTPDTDFPLFVGWYTSGRLDLDGLVTARYRLDDINQACADLQAGRIAGRAILDFTRD
jgi:S-(hydroxymethyl)glutathione dehydrogenase/alcohol dehydrogenase